MDWQEANEAFAAFPGREAALRNITRYSLYRVMFYRTNLFTHSKRVAWIAREIGRHAERVFGASFNSERAVITALVHDDHEIIMGDVQRGNKNKMNAEQKAELQKIEERAIETIVKQYPQRVGPYRYRDLIWSAHHLDCLEAQVVEFADKFDAFGEALHEVFGGNTTFTENVTNEYGTIERRFTVTFPFSRIFPTNIRMSIRSLPTHCHCYKSQSSLIFGQSRSAIHRTPRPRLPYQRATCTTMNGNGLFFRTPTMKRRIICTSKKNFCSRRIASQHSPVKAAKDAVLG